MERVFVSSKIMIVGFAKKIGERIRRYNYYKWGEWKFFCLNLNTRELVFLRADVG